MSLLEKRAFLAPFIGQIATGAVLLVGQTKAALDQRRLQGVVHRLFNRLFRGKAPARQVVAGRPNGQLDTQAQLHVLTHSGPVLQGKVHLQLFGALVTNRLLNRLLLGLVQAASTAGLFASNARLELTGRACSVQVLCGVDSCPA